MVQGSNKEINNKTYREKFVELTDFYLKEYSPQSLNSGVVEYKVRSFYTYSGLKLRKFDLPEVVENYVSYILYKQQDSNIYDPLSLGRIYEYNKIIADENCQEILKYCHLKQDKASEKESLCLDTYGKTYVEAMYVAAQAKWATPAGCCKLMILDEYGATIETYR